MKNPINEMMRTLEALKNDTFQISTKASQILKLRKPVAEGKLTKEAAFDKVMVLVEDINDTVKKYADFW